MSKVKGIKREGRGERRGRGGRNFQLPIISHQLPIQNPKSKIQNLKAPRKKIRGVIVIDKFK